MKKLLASLMLLAGVALTVGAYVGSSSSLKYVGAVNYPTCFSASQTVSMTANGQSYSFIFYSDGTFSGSYPGGTASGNYYINGANSISLNGTACSCMIGLVNSQYKLNSFHYAGYQYSRKANVVYN